MPDAAQHSAQPELPSPYQPGKRRGRARRTHTVAKVLLATLLTLGLVSGLSVAFLYRHLNGNLNVQNVDDQLGTDRPAKVRIDAPKQPMNILVMGSDSRDCDGCKIDGEAGGGSDTTILFHLSADRESAYGVSIPRDSLVTRPDCIAKNGDTIPGGSVQMWNAAYSYGGPACTIKQFEATTGVRIDNYVVVDFGSFQQMVDAVDGVEVCVPEDIDSSEYGITIPAGTRTLSGKEALAYVRVRHGVGDGSDIGRIKRQQAFIGALVAKVPSGRVRDPTGRRLAGPLRSGEPVTDAALVGPSLVRERPDLVALPVRLPDTAMAELLRAGDVVDVIAADPQGGPAATVARDALVLALPPPPADAAADGLPGRLVVLGVREPDVAPVSSATVTHFLTVAWSR